MRLIKLEARVQQSTLATFTGYKISATPTFFPVLPVTSADGHTTLGRSVCDGPRDAPVCQSRPGTTTAGFVNVHRPACFSLSDLLLLQAAPCSDLQQQVPLSIPASTGCISALGQCETTLTITVPANCSGADVQAPYHIPDCPLVCWLPSTNQILSEPGAEPCTERLCCHTGETCPWLHLNHAKKQLPI